MTSLHWGAQHEVFHHDDPWRLLEYPEEKGFGSYYPDHSRGSKPWSMDWHLCKDEDVARSQTRCSVLHSMIRELLDAGADVNAVAQDGSSPLHHAVHYANDVFVRALLEAGADPNLRARNGRPPLYYALGRHVPPRLSVMLVERGADRGMVARECVEDDMQAWVECARKWHAYERSKVRARTANMRFPGRRSGGYSSVIASARRKKAQGVSHTGWFRIRC